MIPVSLTGLLLAGGKSSRMGRSKSALVLDGETLLVRQLRLLTAVGCTECLVSTAADATEPPAWPASIQARMITDRFPGAGPLAGIERGLAEARGELILVVAVDLPALSPVLLRALLAEASRDQGVVPVRAGRFEPLVAVYPKSLQAEAEARLRRGELALQRFVRAGLDMGRLRLRAVSGAEESCFTNWNRPEDVAAPEPAS